MTVEEFTAQLPGIANNTMPMKPPFIFNGLTARTFPLRASLETLYFGPDIGPGDVPPEDENDPEKYARPAGKVAPYLL